MQPFHPCYCPNNGGKYGEACFHESFGMNNQTELFSQAVPRILIMEKDRGLLKSISLTLQRHGIQVARVSAETGPQESGVADSPDLLLVDHDSYPEISGEWIQMLREQNPRKPLSVIVTTSHRMDETWRQKYRPDLVLYKPYDIRFLFRAIRSLL